MTKKERMQEYLRGYRERQEARVKLRKSYAAAEKPRELKWSRNA